MAKFATVTDYVAAQPQPHRATITALLPSVEEALQIHGQTIQRPAPGSWELASDLLRCGGRYWD